MCTGRVDLSFIFRAFAKGADGVIIGGCWPGECHYVTEGNFDALANMHLGRKLMARVGLRPERLRLEWVAASEGARFAELMTAFSNEMRDLGPLGKPEGLDADTLKLRLGAIDRLIPYLKLVERERLRPPVRSEDGINQFYLREEADLLFDQLVGDQLLSSQILLLLEERPLTTAELSQKLGLSSAAVAKQIKLSSSKGLVRYDQAHGTYALARERGAAE